MAAATLDNYATHKTALIHRWLAKHPRYNLHFTPTGASWITSSSASSRSWPSSEDPKPFGWTKTAHEILDNVARSCRRTLDSTH